ncbi:MAG: hypothetical protein OEL55_00865 [Desulfobulbaceae bacterium]|nr:hypothetical protein [Desulfobulbaceae bacterium]
MTAATKKKENNLAIGAVDLTALDRVNTAILQVSVGLVVMLTGLAGIWGLASLVSAMAQSGGLGGMVKGFMTAISGQ